MSKKSKDDVVYFNVLNSSGLYSTVPVKGRYDDDVGGWWSRDGNMWVEKLGVHVVTDRCIKFTSTSKREVQIWTDGALSAMKLLSVWSSTGVSSPRKAKR